MSITLTLSDLARYVLAAHGSPRSLSIAELDVLDERMDRLAVEMDDLFPSDSGWSHRGEEPVLGAYVVVLENSRVTSAPADSIAKAEAACEAAIREATAALLPVVDATEATMRAIREAGGTWQEEMRVISGTPRPRRTRY